jgi:exodeoxyribonuclease V alpha subunit
VTVLGSLPSASVGERLTAEGWWVRDKQHGLQFKAKALKAVQPFLQTRARVLNGIWLAAS